MIRILALALIFAVAAPAMAAQYSWHIDKTITLDTTPDPEPQLLQTMYFAFQGLSYCNSANQIAKEKGIYVPLTAITEIALYLLRPISEDITLYSPATKEVEANARAGIVDTGKSYHYSLFAAKIESVKAQVPGCAADADALKVAFDNYLQWRISQAQAGK